ncbi:MAG: hypothetical protein ACM31C_30515 [Acidobacteriota bacterium]
MARHRTFAAAFFATVAVVVPAAWHGLDATIDKEGKHVRPLQQEIDIDGARVTLDVNHNLVHSGDSVVAKLQAFSDTPKQVAVDLTLMRSDDTFGSRVAAPPKAIDKEHFTLEAGPDGGKVVETKLTMVPTGTGNKVDWFRIFVSKRGDKVDAYSGEEGDDRTAAAIGVLGWTENDFAISIKPKGKVDDGDPFEVDVRVENTTDHALKHAPYINLGTSVGLSGLQDTDAFKIEDASDDDGTASEKRFRPGAVVVKKFTVTPQGTGAKEVTFVASAYVWGEDISPIVAGAMDAHTFEVAPAPKHEEPTPAVAQQ